MTLYFHLYFDNKRTSQSLRPRFYLRRRKFQSLARPPKTLVAGETLAKPYDWIFRLFEKRVELFYIQIGYLLQCTPEYCNFPGECFGSSDWGFQICQTPYKLVGTRKIVPAQVL